GALGRVLSGPDVTNAFVFGRFGQIVTVLEIQPELGRGPEVASQPQCGVRGDAALAAHDVVDARRWDIEFARESPGRKLEGLHELGLQDLSGMEGKGLHGCTESSCHFTFAPCSNLPAVCSAICFALSTEGHTPAPVMLLSPSPLYRMVKRNPEVTNGSMLNSNRSRWSCASPMIMYLKGC